MLAGHAYPGLNSAASLTQIPIQEPALIQCSHGLIALNRALANCLSLLCVTLCPHEPANIYLGRLHSAPASRDPPARQVLASISNRPKDIAQILCALGVGLFWPKQGKQVLSTLRPFMGTHVRQQSDGFHGRKCDCATGTHQVGGAEERHAQAVRGNCCSGASWCESSGDKVQALRCHCI